MEQIEGAILLAFAVGMLVGFLIRDKICKEEQ